MTPLRLSSPAARRPVLAGLLAFALVFAQWLGLLHRSLHDWGASAAPAGVRVVSSATVPAASPEVDCLRTLFGAHADDASCRLYDHAASVAAGLSAALALPQPLPQATPLWAPRPAPAAAPRAAFQARAPPLRG